MSKEEIEGLFPNLVNTDYTIISPDTVEYNCIAWAVGDTKAWWWPDPFHQYYWPSEIPRNESLEAFIKAFEILDYAICRDAEYEEGFEKTAIYVDANGKPTHASRQLSSGRWTSKLGRLEDIEHDFDVFFGSQYGSIAVIMKRPREGNVDSKTT
jgi:hypothetical protein